MGKNLPHQPILKRFQHMNTRARLAHAYLFVGPAGMGKTETAVNLAKLLNCEKRSQPETLFCDLCPSCLKINSGNHPDVHTIAAMEEEASIKIEHVRERLLEQIRLRPFFSQKKIFIIRNIEDMTPDAGNALLKTLEEPSGKSLLLLTTAFPERILDTIKSRCHKIHFTSEPVQKLAARLTKDYDIDAPSAHFFAYYAEGNGAEAIRLKKAKAFEMKNEIIDRIIFESGNEAYLKNLLAEKEKVKDFLKVLLSWLRDSLLFKAGVEPQRLIHRDRLRELDRFQGIYSFKELNELIASVVGMNRMLLDGLNIKIPLQIIQNQLAQR